MRTATDIRLSRRVIAVVIAAIGVTLTLPRGHQMREARRDLADLSERAATGKAATIALDAETQRWRDQIDRNRAARASAQAAANALEKELATIDPESRWTTPPTADREWDPQSPYVWLRKDLLASFTMSPFDDRGHLRPEIATFLSADTMQIRALDAAVSRLDAENKRLEIANAKLTDRHPPGVKHLEGAKQLTLRVESQPETSGRMLTEFRDALRSALGAQRAELIEDTAEEWLRFKGQSKTFSVVRQPDGSFDGVTEIGTTKTSTSGSRTLETYVPQHLLPFFSALEGNSGDGAPPSP